MQPAVLVWGEARASPFATHRESDAPQGEGLDSSAASRPNEFSFFRNSQFFTPFDSCLWTSLLAQEYFIRVPYRYGARRGRLRGVERGAEVRKQCRASKRVERSGSADPGSFRKRAGQTPVSGADGSSECPGDSSHERGEVSASDRSLGHLSKPTNPSACGTQAKGCFRGPGSAGSDLAREGWATARVPLTFKRRAGCPAGSRAGRGSGLLANAFRTLPFGGNGPTEDRLALWPN